MLDCHLFLLNLPKKMATLHLSVGVASFLLKKKIGSNFLPIFFSVFSALEY